MSANGKTLIAIPTFRSRQSVEEACRSLLASGLQADILVIDSGPAQSGDQLVQLTQKPATVAVVRAVEKLKAGAAHLAALRYAYEGGYQTLVTTDCDPAVTGSEVSYLLEKHDGHDLTIASRALPERTEQVAQFEREAGAMRFFRISRLLGFSFDVNSTFRAYRLSKIPSALFDLATSPGHAFFVETLFILNLNGFSIAQVSTGRAQAAARSSVRFTERLDTSRKVLALAAASWLYPGQFRAVPELTELDPALHDPQDWNVYWERKNRKINVVYDFIATIYRNLVIRRNLKRTILRIFPAGSRLLHAGCGGGQVDQDLQGIMRITALDISPAALQDYKKNNPRYFAVKHGDILKLSFPNDSFDGYYNLGVVEHFTEPQILQILAECHRVLVPGGKVVIFWPHVHAPSVYVLRFAVWFFATVFKRRVQFHPAEVSLLRSKQQVKEFLERSNLTMTSFKLSPRDLYIQAIIVAEKPLPSLDTK